MSIRVRYAPSPTGKLHVGNLRTALFDYLFAKRNGGACILRIEDTDRSRYSAEAEAYQYEALRWVGVEFDESPQRGGPHAPYRQSERKEAGVYEPYIRRMLDEGFAYKAFETEAELAEMREYQKVNKLPEGYYGGSWRDASLSQVEDAERAGTAFVIRLRMPHGTTITAEDAIRGRIEWNSNDLVDPVLIKADGMPTYHFAAMVDDHLMGISHVIRGEEWISSLPNHVQLFDSFGWERPQFVHCPVIKGRDGKKLSKRHGATTVLDYKAMGFLPDALANFVALIGWSPKGDREVLSRQELIESFDLAGLQPSSGVFDFAKLLWMNGLYIRSMEVDRLLEQVSKFADDPLVEEFYQEQDAEMPHADIRPGLACLRDGIKTEPKLAAEAIRLEQKRVNTLAQFAEMTAFFFVSNPPMDAKAVEKWFPQPHVRELLQDLKAAMSGRESILAEECEAWIRDYAAERQFEKLGAVVHPVRVALTGTTIGPGLFELMTALGPARMRDRLDRALEMLP
jgi:glutamyl-tRNA synthetase